MRLNLAWLAFRFCNGSVSTPESIGVSVCDANNFLKRGEQIVLRRWYLNVNLVSRPSAIGAVLEFYPGFLTIFVVSAVEQGVDLAAVQFAHQLFAVVLLGFRGREYFDV